MAVEDVERWPRWWAWLYSLCSGDPRSNREIVRVAAPTQHDRIVDVGCGAGAAVRHAARSGAAAVGVDPSPAMVDIARRRNRDVHGARFAVGDAAHLPMDDASVTIAWAVASYHHWPDRRAGLTEIRRVLAPGGRLLLGERRLRRGGGHGMSTGEANDTAALLHDVGYREVAVQTLRLRLLTMVILTATA